MGATTGHETEGRHTGAAIAIFLRLPGFELFLGEAEIIDKHEVAGLGEVPAIVLKFSGDVGPNPSGLADFEHVIPLKPVAEFLNKDESERASDLTVGRKVGHGDSPKEDCEITPEMIEAGAKVICDFFDTKYDDITRDLVKEVWAAMYRVRSLS